MPVLTILEIIQKLVGEDGGESMKHPCRAEKKLFIKDMSLLIIFLFSAIVVFAFVLFQVLHLPDNNMVVCIILTVSSITAISMLWASGEVMVHLRRNQGHIYKEDLICQKYILEQKRALLYEKQ
jgi:hypothetical protein